MERWSSQDRSWGGVQAGSRRDTNAANKPDISGAANRQIGTLKSASTVRFRDHLPSLWIHFEDQSQLNRHAKRKACHTDNYSR